MIPEKHAIHANIPNANLHRNITHHHFGGFNNAIVWCVPLARALTEWEMQQPNHPQNRLRWI